MDFGEVLGVGRAVGVGFGGVVAALDGAERGVKLCHDARLLGRGDFNVRRSSRLGCWIHHFSARAIRARPPLLKHNIYRAPVFQNNVHLFLIIRDFTFSPNFIIFFVCAGCITYDIIG